MELKISREKWESLSDQQRQNLRDLGIEEPAAKAQCVRTVNTLKVGTDTENGYYLGQQTRCITCGEIHTEVFYMHPFGAGKKAGLTATCPIGGFKVSSQTEPDQWAAVQKTKTCSKCEENLLQWDKKKLIQYILHGQRKCIGCAKDNFTQQQARIGG